MPRIENAIGFLLPFMLGALVGLPMALGIYWALQPSDLAWLPFLLICPITGLLAVRYGDEFWESVILYFPWF